MTHNRSFCSALAVWFSGFFGLGAIVHGTRLILRLPLVVGTFAVPLRLSAVAVVILSILSVGLLYLVCRRTCATTPEKGSC